MTSRRVFIQRAGALAGAGVWHGLAGAAAGAAPLDGSLPERVRRELLLPQEKNYLNTGSLGPSPRAVLDTVVDAMWTLERDPVSENWGRLGQQMEAVRRKVANFIHADAKQVLLTRNTTEGLSLVCQVLPLQAGDEIVTTTLEHGGGEVGLEYLVKTRGAVLKKVALPLPPENKAEIVKVIEQALTPATRLLMLSHVNTITGLLMPLAEISAIARARGIFLLIDGAQAPGLTPVDVKAIGADAYASSGHKWLLGPKETGFLYLKDGFPGLVPPVFTLYGLDVYTQSSGTRNVATIMGLGAAIDWHTSLGVETTTRYCTALRTECYAKLKRIPGVKMLSPENPALATGIVSFEIPHRKNSEIYGRLRERNVIVKVLPQHNGIRISCHVFVTSADIDQFITLLTTMV